MIACTLALRTGLFACNTIALHVSASPWLLSFSECMHQLGAPRKEADESELVHVCISQVSLASILVPPVIPHLLADIDIISIVLFVRIVESDLYSEAALYKCLSYWECKILISLHLLSEQIGDLHCLVQVSRPGILICQWFRVCSWCILTDRFSFLYLLSSDKSLVIFLFQFFIPTSLVSGININFGRRDWSGSNSSLQYYHGWSQTSTRSHGMTTCFFALLITCLIARRERDFNSELKKSNFKQVE